MTIPTFNPPINPSPGLTANPELRGLEADFGDGYTQPTPDGINHMRQVVELSWELLEADQMQEIRDFLEARKGVDSFRYTLPGEVIARTYRCPEWQVKALQADLYSISATFRQTFGGAS